MNKKRPVLMLIAIFLGAAVLAYGKAPDQPHMNAARASFQTAKNELKVAEHNKVVRLTTKDVVLPAEVSQQLSEEFTLAKPDCGGGVVHIILLAVVPMDRSFR